MRFAVRLSFALLALFAIVALVLPLALYWVGLNGVDGLPPKPVRLVSHEQQLFVWRQARGVGMPSVVPMDPYSVTMALFASSGRSPADELIAWWVASDYLIDRQRYKGMGWWHLSGTTLTIWLSRNWSSQELLSAAVLSFQRRGAPPPSGEQIQSTLDSASHDER